MKRIRIIGMALIAVFALSAIIASVASAALPEIGECVAKAGGKYKDSACQETIGKKEGSFEKLKTVANAHFTSTSGAGKLETVGGAEVKCTGDTDSGEYAPPKSVTAVHVTFTGCTTLGTPCQTAGSASGEIVTSELVGTFGYISPTEVGLSLTPATKKGAFAEFSCAGGLVNIVVKEGAGTKSGNSVIGAIVPVNTMSTTATLTFSQAAGVQMPTAFMGGKEDVLESSLNGATPEQAGEETIDTITNGGAVEIFA